MPSKKGQASTLPTTSTAKLLLSIVGFVVIIGVLILVFGDNTIDELVCKISVNLADQTHGAFPVVCRTFDKVLNDDENSAVKFQIADHMRKCWSMWGEGDLNVEGKNVFFGDEFKCYKCYRLQFPEYEDELSYYEMEDYLEKTQTSNFEEETYVNYFNNNAIFNLRDEESFDNMIRKDEQYAITFVEHVEKNKWTRIGGFTATAIGTCIAIPGVGWAALPGCAAVGLGGGLLDIGTDAFLEYISGKRERDGIMFSEYDAVENYCGGFIE